MRKLIIKLFVKDWDRPEEPEVRERFGKLAGIVGICTNGLLSAAKILLGFLFGSLSVLADGINNLADASSSVITLIGFRMAAKPADQDHPYGHARIEYITGLIVSFVIIFLGLQLLLSSIRKIMAPVSQEFSLLTVGILILAILLKIWQALFNMDIGKRIGSATLKATGLDSRNDVIATSAVLVSLLIEKATGLMLDGWMGAVVALFILWSGIQLVRETSAPLLGEAPSQELVDAIHDRILSFSDVLGVHDLMVHDYGPGRIFSSVHVEVNASKDILESHELMDMIETILSKELKIHLVCHMDPIDADNSLLQEWNCRLTVILNEIDPDIGFHDLRMVPGPSHTNLIFDIVIPYGYFIEEEELKKTIDGKVKETDPSCFAVICIDRGYTGPTCR